MLYIDSPLMQELATDGFYGGKTAMMISVAVFVENLLRKRFDEAFQYAMAPQDSRDVIACETAVVRLAAGMVVNFTARSICEQALSPSVRLTLTELAREAGLSRYQLLRGFARETGVTTHSYILQRRIALARRLIRGGSRRRASRCHRQLFRSEPPQSMFREAIRRYADSLCLECLRSCCTFVQDAPGS